MDMALMSMAAVRPSPSIVNEVVPLEVHPCGRCSTFYDTYKLLLEHLYWRHGTESRACKRCGLRKWLYAAHVCHVLPIEELLVLEDCPSAVAVYCSCRRYFEDVPMIACDGPECPVQWYHFECVGVSSPPDGDWFCPQCWNKLNCGIVASNI